MALYKSANALLKRLTATHHTSPYGVGSSGVSIYDTAWVSIVSRNVEQTGTRAWVFPKSFEYICSSQAEDGGWHGDGSLIDSIMNTLASLLSLKLHEKDGWQLPDLSDKVERARLFLDNVLQKWDVPSTERIAFELIVPRILQFLEEEGISFEFPHRAALENLRDQKLKLLDLDLVYRGQTPVLYTLEAFVGVLDFDRLRTLKVNGSFLTSPASTAAYLTYCSVWDEEAEDYLRQALRRCSAYGEGAVCTVWPTTLFEFSWTICNLMESGFEREKLDESCLNRVGQVLHSALVAGNGLVGWDALKSNPDADDTGKATAALQYIGKPYPIDSLLETFERTDYFACHQFERNPSLSSNCNILLTLLAFPRPGSYLPQILKILKFVAGAYSEALHVEDVRDKWHTSPWYVAMLATQGFVRFVHLYGKDYFAALDVPKELTTSTIPGILFRFLTEILQCQNGDGSWGLNHNIEETAYCVIALAHLTSLPYDVRIREKVAAVIGIAREYLKVNAEDSKLIKSHSQIWTGKVTYGVEFVCEAYVISALHIHIHVGPSDSLVSNELAEHFRKATLL